MIYALFGLTCSGKTSVADELRRRYSVPIRHCGAAVKAAASARGIDVAEMSNEDHQAIDSETRRIAEAADADLIVEGTFLDVVLKGVPGVRLIRLVCSEAERTQRFIRRHCGTSDGFAQREAFDHALRMELYGGQSQCREFVEVDTTGRSLEQVCDDAWRIFKDVV